MKIIKKPVIHGRHVHNFALTIPGPDLQAMRRLRREVHIMPEWVHVILSVCFGAGLWPAPHALFRIASPIVGIVLLASSAFVASGECYITWRYFLIDLAQAVLEFAAGAIAAHFIAHRARGDGANYLSVASAHSRN